MELIKKNIHMLRQKGMAVSQITLDDDYNMPDVNGDAVRLIGDSGEIGITEVKAMENRVSIKGALRFSVLYMGEEEDKKIQSLKGDLFFDETVNLEGVSDGGHVHVRWELEDLSVNIINSRKLSIRALVTFFVAAEELYDEELPVEAPAEGQLFFCSQKLECLQMAVNKRDTYRVRDEIILPANKPNIYEVLWDDIQLRGLDIQVGEDKITLKGEALVFILYATEEEENRYQWYETTVVFNGAMDCGGCREDMVSDIRATVIHRELEPKEDFDGEDRLLNLDMVLELDIKVYREERLDLLTDAYATDREISIVRRPAVYENLLVKNFSKCRAVDRVKIAGDMERILQICHCDGTVKIDSAQPIENGLDIEGVLSVNVLYITAEDKMPFNAVKGMIPFHQIVEAPGIGPNCQYSLSARVEQLTTTVVDSEEVEVKAVIALDTFVMKKIPLEIIDELQEGPLDLDKIQEKPGIIGYIVREGDSLWDIARQNYTTVRNIQAINELKEEKVKPGEKLVIVKSVLN